MMLNNMKTYINTFLFGNTLISEKSQTFCMQGSIVNMSGSVKNMISILPSTIPLGYMNTGYNELVVGAGTTPVAETDYCLADELVTGDYVTLVTGTNKAITGLKDGKPYVTISSTFNYKGTAEIDITEVGLKRSDGLYGEGGGGTTTYLLAREVLETPIHVKPNEDFTVSLTFEL